MSTRSLAIIGLGQRISGVARNLLKTEPRLRLVGYADPQPAGAENLSKNGIDPGKGFTDPSKMLAELKPDHVLIGSPNHLHLQHIEAALAAGCHVFSEKPVVISAEETWRAAELLRDHGQERFLVGLVLRSSEIYRRVQAAVTSGRIGNPVSLEANEILGPEHGGFLMRDWRRFRRYSGSHLLEKCCHDIDLHQALVGSRLVRVASFGGRSIFTPENREELQGGDPKRYRSWSVGWKEVGNDDPFNGDGDICDHQVACGEFENGARWTFTVNNHGAWHQRRWLLCGHRGSVESDLGCGRLKIQEVFGKPEEADLSGGGGHYGADENMARDLAAAWFDGVPFPVPTRAALEAGLSAMAADQAMVEKRIVDLSDHWRRLDGILAKSGQAAARKSGKVQGS